METYGTLRSTECKRYKKRRTSVIATRLHLASHRDPAPENARSLKNTSSLFWRASDN